MRSTSATAHGDMDDESLGCASCSGEEATPAETELSVELPLWRQSLLSTEMIAAREKKSQEL
jgi:hypothetical protein